MSVSFTFMAMAIMSMFPCERIHAFSASKSTSVPMDCFVDEDTCKQPNKLNGDK